MKLQRNHDQDVANMMDAHRQAGAALGIGRERPAVPAPPLEAHGYQTDKGYQQNADGVVEGNLYPDGFPGPYIEIPVSFSGFHLNDPIKVNLAFRTQAYAGRKALVR